MIFLLAISQPSVQLILLGTAAAMVYLVSRLVLGAIPPRIDRPASRAMLAAAGVAIIAAVTIVAGRPMIGLHLPMATAMAAMTFGVASLIVGRPAPAHFAANRSWALLAPAVAILFIGGLGGRLDGYVIGALAIYGAAALLAWRRDAVEPLEPGEGKARRLGGRSTPLLWLGAAIVVGLAAWLAILGIPALETRQRFLADPLVVGFLLAPAVVVPIFFELLPPCRPIGWNASMSTLVLFALLCLCFVLPAAALVQADVLIVKQWLSLTSPATQPTTIPATMSAVVPASSDPIPRLGFPSMPIVALRVDLLVLLAATLMCVPLAAGWLRPGKLEAMALVAAYVLGLLLMMATVMA